MKNNILHHKTHLFTIPALIIILIMILPVFPGCKNKKQDSGKKDIIESAPVITNVDNNHDMTPAFMEAALNGDFDNLKKMVKGGMDVNTTDEENRTALMLAAYNGHTDIVKYLLDNGAKINTLDNMGRHALIYASSGPFPETVKVLLHARADPNIIAKGDGWTALMYASAEGQLEVVKILLDNGADPTIREVDGDDAKSFAHKNGHTAVVHYLQKHSKK